MADNTQNVETVVIEEPSDKVELAHDETSRCTKTRVYVALGLLVVIAVSLIGTLLSFSPSSSSGVNQSTLKAGTQATFPTFDTNNDGFIDQNEMSNWISERIAARKIFTTPQDPEPAETVDSDDDVNAGNGSTTPTTSTTTGVTNPCDYNGDGRLSLIEVIECVLYLFELLIKEFSVQPRLMNAQPRLNTKGLDAAINAQSTSCEVPEEYGFPAQVPGGWVGACDLAHDLWCFMSPFCLDPERCGTLSIPGEVQTDDTCCGTGDADDSQNAGSGTQCVTCSCGKTYHFVPHGHNARITAMCAPFTTFWCGKIDTHVPCW